MDEQATGGSGYSGAAAHLLYIESNAGVATQMQQQLRQQCDFDVEIALDAEEGLRRLQCGDFDLALVDYDLPVLNGLQLLNILRDNGIATPVVILSSEGDEEIATAVMKAGAVNYLPRRADGSHVDRICESVRRICRESAERLHDELCLSQQRLAKKVFDVTREGIVVTNADVEIIAVNPAFTEITGYTFEEVVGKNPSILRSDLSDEDFYRRMWQELEKWDCWEGEIWNKKRSGEVYPAWLTINVTRDDGGAISEFIGVFTDITRRKADEEKVWHQANYDRLTDLPNRALLMDRARTALDRARREHTSMALMFVDLDRFKHINDHYGHAVGDELLIEVAGRFAHVLRQSDTVIRLSGDEFIVLMPVIHRVVDAGRVAQKVIEILSQPCLIAGHTLSISASAGVTVFPGDGDDIDTLLRHADMAMYKAKEQGRNQYLFFDQQMNLEAEYRNEIERQLQTAIEQHQLVMYYQPVVDLSNNRITHAEALIRWQHPQRGLLLPGDFVPVAENSGLIMRLGEWVIQNVCRQMDAWRDAFGATLQVSLNISSNQMVHANLEAQLASAMHIHHSAAGYLSLEVKEHVFSEGVDVIRARLETLQQMGLHFMIDDFGTGFSSMRDLRQLPFDALKIDRSFIAGIDSDAEQGVLVRSMINIAHSLNLKVVAEGIEREAEAEFLRDSGCDCGQGYLFGKPVAVAEFQRLLEAQQQ